MNAAKGEAPTLGPVGASLNPPSDSNRQENQVINSTQVAAARAITVPFHGADLYVVEREGQPYTPMKPIVEGVGLTWHGQHRKLTQGYSHHENTSGRWGVAILTIPLQGGAQEMLAMPLRKLPGWLATIDPGRIKNPEVRARVIQYQNECDDVLWQYWNEGIAINPRATYSMNPDDVLTKEEADTLRQMVEGMAKKLTNDTKVQGKFILQAWSKLKAHFHVSYRQIPRNELTEAVSIINRHTVEWEVVDDVPTTQPVSDAERLKLANRLASHAASIVHQTVFDAVLDGDKWWNHNRYLLAFNAGTDGKFSAPWAKPIGQEDMVVSMADLPRRLLEPGGILPSSKDLANLAAACNQRLAHRMQFQAQKRGEA